MPRGRPVHSVIRQNLVELLHFLGHGHGYEVYKIYLELFPKTTLRSIYYNLKRGLQTGEFRVLKVESEKGDYSWGGQVQHTYYALGDQAQPVGLERIEKYLVERKLIKSNALDAPLAEESK